MKVRDSSTQESQPEGKRKRLPKSIKIIIWVIGGVLVLAGIGFAVLNIYMNATVYKDAVDIVAAPETSVVGEPDIEEISEEEYLSDQDAEGEEEYVQQEPEDIYEAIEISDRIYNVLVIGDDARITQDHGRSDSMLLCSYNRDTGDIKVVSFMRDMLVPTTEGGSWKRINSTYASGGSGKTINTINRLFALDIQRYVIVRFDSVFALVDEIDGIDIEITSAEARYVNRIFPEYDQLSEGLAHMNGRQALAYARARHVSGVGGGGDFGRVVRQQKAIAAVFDKARKVDSAKGMLALVNFLFENVQTNVPLNEVVTMGMEILQSGHMADETMRIPVDGLYRFGRYHGASILKITSIEKTVLALHQYLYGDAHTPEIPYWGSFPPMDTPTPKPSPSPSPTDTGEPTPTETPEPTPTETPEPTPTETPEPTPTETPEPTPTETPPESTD